MTSITHSGAPVRAYKADAPVSDAPPLEPKDALPTPTPFKAGVGTWLGTGAGALVGAGVGLGAGGLIGLAAASNMGGGGGIGAVFAGVGALAGLVGGGLLVYNGIKSSHEKGEHARVQAEHGTSTLEYARGMIHQFDHNTNGSIDLVNSTGLASQDERVFSEERRQSQSHPKYDVWNDEWRSETERWTETRGTSAANIWNLADSDPKDEVVTDRELATLMSKFDTNKSGSLTTSEQDAFKQAHPVIVDQWRR